MLFSLSFFYSLLWFLEMDHIVGWGGGEFNQVKSITTVYPTISISAHLIILHFIVPYILYISTCSFNFDSHICIIVLIYAVKFMFYFLSFCILRLCDFISVIYLASLKISIMRCFPTSSYKKLSGFLTILVTF